MPDPTGRPRVALAFAAGLLVTALLWPRTRITAWTAYAPGPPFAELHLSESRWVSTVGLPTTYPLALFAGLVVGAITLLLIRWSRAPH